MWGGQQSQSEEGCLQPGGNYFQHRDSQMQTTLIEYQPSSLYQPPSLYLPSRIPTISTQLSIDKALQFVGDNSSYQRRRLLLIATIVFALAMLTNRMALEPSFLTLLFLIASGAGQVICPIYLSLRTCTMAVGGSALLAAGLYPLGGVIRDCCLMGLGFFTRGFFISALIYLNEIGGDSFRSWAMLVIFGLWPISALFNSLDGRLGLERWTEYYMCVFLPCLVGTYYILEGWHPSPHYLYFKKQYADTKMVLNAMAQENRRPFLPYGLEGEHSQQNYRRPVYLDLLNKPLLWAITFPLCLLWVYREHIYYASNMMVPELGRQHSRIYLLVSLSEAVAILLFYPLRIHVKRVNSIAASVILVLAVSLLSSFSRVPPECMEEGKNCLAKTLYFFTMMMVRFAMALLGLVLITYTLEVYPSNVRRLGFGVCFAVSSLGSIAMPWVGEVFIYWGLSGFITFAISSAAVLVLVPRLEETYGQMKTETLEQLENKSASTLKNWALLDFSD